MSSTVTAAAVRRRARPRYMPWRDRQGRLSLLKSVVLVGSCVPALLIGYWWLTGELGPRRVNAAIHLTGLWALRFVLLSLAVTPARLVLDRPQVVLVRRMLGVTAAAYAVAHLGLYVVDMNFHLLEVALEIVRRFYLTIGFLALIGLVALAATSTDAAVRRMGRSWKWLHRSIYGIGVLMLLHHFLQAKAGVSAAVFVSGLFIWLMLWRALPAARQASPWVLGLLALAAGLLTAGLEFAWYALATRINPWRVLEANLGVAFGPRPAEWVAIAGLGVVVLHLLSRLRPGFWRA
jgi:sulfoxide reductase heme-binding subunit YedZ